jgi:hypothetical protein
MKPRYWHGAVAISNSQPFAEADATAIVNKVRVSFERLRNGAGEQDDFLRIGCAINVAHMRAQNIGGNAEVVAILNDAGLAMHDAQDRKDRIGRYGLTGPGQHAVAAGIDAYEAILRASSPRQMHAAQEALIRRLDRMGLPA